MELIPFTTKDLASFLEMSHDMYDSPAVAHPVSRDIFISTTVGPHGPGIYTRSCALLGASCQNRCPRGCR